MTEEVFRTAMAEVSESIKKNGDFRILRDLVDPNERIITEGALELFAKDSSSRAVREFLEKQELQKKPVTDSVVAWGDIAAYYVVGSDCKSSISDGIMSYVFEDLYCISTTGKLFKYSVLNVSSIISDYDNTLSLSIEPYSSHGKWYANLNALTHAEESPLHRFHQLFQD